MKIAFVDFILDPTKPGRTGLSDLVWDMAKRLTRFGDEVHIVAPYTFENFPDRQVHVHRFSLPVLAYQNILGHSLIILRAYRTLQQLGAFDVIHTPEYHSAAIIGSLQRGTPVVFTEPGNIYERIAYGNPYDPITTQTYKLAARVAARRCAQLIATSEWMKEWWHRTGVPLGRITLIPLGVDTTLFRPKPDARRTLGIAEDALVILCVTRQSRENGVDTVLKAAAQVLKDVPASQLHLVGDGPENKHLRCLARDLGITVRTTWHGWIDLEHLPLYYSAADVFVFAGRSGGTPRVLLQAMACGTAVVASRIGGITDHIKEGETGLLFTMDSNEELANKIVTLLFNPNQRRQLGRNAISYVRMNADWDLLVNRVHEVYRKVSSLSVDGHRAG